MRASSLSNASTSETSQLTRVVALNVRAPPRSLRSRRFAPSASATPSQPAVPGIGGKQLQPTSESKVVTMLLNSANIPSWSYVPEPRSFLHDIDARIKQLYLIVLLMAVARTPIPVRLCAAAAIIALTAVALPPRLWKAQLSQLLILAGFVFVSVMLSADGVPPVLLSHSAPDSLYSLPPLTPEQPGYQFVVAQIWFITITKRSISLAVTSACLVFTALQSASLCLTTTPAEAMAKALAWFLRPLKIVGAPVEEVHMTLLLSLRFMGIVFEEVRNLTLGVASRGINWKALGFGGSVAVLMTTCGRLFNNLFQHAENISQSMIMRGFTTPEAHRFQLQQLRPTSPILNAVAMLGLAALVAASTWAA